MRKSTVVVLLIVVLTVAAPLGPSLNAQAVKQTSGTAPELCYSCFWDGAEIPAELIRDYRQQKTSDPFVSSDISYVLWRATNTRNCNALEGYRQAAENDPDLNRRFLAEAALGFASPECEQDASQHLKRAAELGEQTGRLSEARTLRALSTGTAQPLFEPVTIAASIEVPANAKALILGESTIALEPGMRIGTQVERVARDWLLHDLNWNLKAEPLAPESVLGYHEGAVVQRILSFVPASVYPLTGTLVARHDDQWFGPDETGIFRFQVLDDKMQYPTTHAARGFGWIEDTHGISALVSQALERKVNLLIGCGDSAGKAQAAYYLSQKGVNVAFPGDRYEHLLIGYRGTGVLMGGAPVKRINGKTVMGHQPIRFSLQETFVVEDTKKLYPVQYYDAPARYFRRLSTFVPLKLDYVNVYDANQIANVLQRADELKASVAAVRVATEDEDVVLREWLGQSRQRRAILFHSGLYPFAQPLFEDFPDQVTFGDLRPRLE